MLLPPWHGSYHRVYYDGIRLSTAAISRAGHKHQAVLKDFGLTPEHIS